ncbi:SdpI/YhfL protein family protein [Muriicola jejuensis]|uniref:SdpI family protein n=1 Tax=Muriicola jejuensis TaxID=504488 RepID=A0A6P0UFU7_9FLAO|nr:SdpI family protein [Muriicola jejuensis]NER11320.1 hypothetical protein [Muriicola jejuensis]SMP21471.1 SdpI/YhfL protein family protein [Muriicola jejuensis]
MSDYHALLATNIFLALLIIALPLLLTYYPPKNINFFYGYRTKSSLKSKKNWDIANRIYPKELLKYSIYTILLQGISFIIWDEKIAIIVGCVLWIFAIFIPIYTTEKSLKKEEA